MIAEQKIINALTDMNLIGAGLAPNGDIETWRNWFVIVKAAYGLGHTLNDEELALFKRLTGGRNVPSRRVRRCVVFAGRRSGKSNLTAAIGLGTALFADTSMLKRGEVGHVMVVSPTRDQSQSIMNYAEGMASSSELIARRISGRTAESLTLNDGKVALTVNAASHRSTRGKTLLAAVIDEATQLRDAESATPDVELVRALTPGLISTGGTLWVISSAYRKAGWMYSQWKDHFGQDSDDVLVIQAATHDLNLSINEAAIMAAVDDDREANRAEYLSEFRDDIGSLIDDDTIEAAINYGRPAELPFIVEDMKHLTFFADISGGRHDASTLCGGFTNRDGTFIPVGVWGRDAPHDPVAVIAEFAEIIRRYRCNRVISDNYAGTFVSGNFERQGIKFTRSKLVKSAIYLESVPHFMQGKVELINHKKSLRELRLLERRVSKSGRDAVDHPKNGSDDYINSVLGCLVHVMKPQRHTVTFAAPQFADGYGNWSDSPSGDGLPPGATRCLV